MNNYKNIPTNQIPAYIDGLCDVLPDRKRKLDDFLSLLNCIENSSKECIPFKGKILQHIQVHALGNPNIDLKLLSICFAKATILFRKTPNKSDGPLDAWKVGFLNEINNLESNLNELYQLAGYNSQKVVDFTDSSTISDLKLVEKDDLKSKEKLSETKNDYQSTINDYLFKVNWAAYNICALIGIKTDFELPIPVQILLKLASKICSLRWKDYKKKPNNLIRSHVYSLTPYLIDISLMIFKQLVAILGSNIIPFSTFINQALLDILEWTRTSNLEKSDEVLYHSTRFRVFNNLKFIIERLSLNINFEPKSLRVLLEIEILDKLDEFLQESSGSSCEDAKNLHLSSVFSCLESLLIVYSSYLELQLEAKIKNLIIHTCIKAYRDFESNVISLECRKQLLNILVLIANQPYASSTTELAYHIFEMVDKYEVDLEMKFVARKSLKIGLAHRPTIVSQYDVYNIYNHPMLTSEPQKSAIQTSGSPSSSSENLKVDEPKGQVVDEDLDDEEVEVIGEISSVDKMQQQQQLSSGDGNGESKTTMDVSTTNGTPPTNCGLFHRGSQISQQPALQKSLAQQEPEDESELSSFMSHFVEKLA